MSQRTELGRPGANAPARTPSQKAEIAAFLAEAHARAPRADGPEGRLIFALDATMSRQPTWDAACALQGEMFKAASRVGGLAVQLVYFRGLEEARASRWVRDAASLGKVMAGINCHGGLTQIARVLDHAGKEAKRAPVAALAYVGDAMEENVDVLCAKAGELALRNIRAFMFLEGRDPAAERAFREIAKLTNGAMLPFDRNAAGELRSLLAAVATYAAGGRAALEAVGDRASLRLLADLRA